MKNLKKVLALVLVVVMALGLITVSNAADFTDAKSITKTEAVEVLSAVEVINGYPDGSFKPEGEVTRAEMAKMVATIMNKGEDVGDLYKNACKFADSANHWAAGYIAYCAQAGIINGKSETKFDPDGKVTGTEAAKMLLCALGYKADAEGYVGANWASAVLARAAEVHLVGSTYNMTANMAEPLNRENAAQIMLNALKADMVKYKGSATTISGNGFTINTGAEVEKKSDTAQKYTKLGNDGPKAGEFYIQLGEEMFDGKLEVDENAKDKYGHPANEWKYDSKVVSCAASIADREYKDTVTGGTLYSDLGKIKFNDYGVNPAVTGEFDFEYIVDGVSVETITAGGTAANQAASTYAKLIAISNKTDFGKVGDKIEVYKNTTSTPKKVTVVVTNFYTTTISNVFAKKANTNGDVTKVAYIQLSGVAAKAPEVDEGTPLTGNGQFPTEAFTSADVGAHVIYTIGHDGANYVIQSVDKAEVVTGLYSSSVAGTTTTGLESVALAGTTYKVATDATFTVPGRNADATAYLDPNGNVWYMEGVASNDFVYLISKDQKTGDFGAKTDVARLVFTDGSVKEVEVAKNNYADDALYTYTKDSKGVYTLTLVPAIGAGASPKAAEYAADTFNGGTSKVNYFAHAKINNATLFIVETWDATAKAATYTTYTGVNNLPTIASANYAGWTTADEAAYIATQVNTVTPAADLIAGSDAVYVTPKGDTYATVVFVFGAKITSSSSDVTALYMTDKDAQTTDADDNTYFEVKAIVNGTETTVKVDTTTHAVISGATKEALTVATSLTIDKDIISNPVENASYVKGPFTFKNDGNTFDGAYKDGNIILSGATYNVDPSIPVYVYNRETRTMTTTTIGAYVPSGDPSDAAFGATTDIVKVRYDVDPTTNDNAKILGFYVVETHE